MKKKNSLNSKLGYHLFTLFFTTLVLAQDIPTPEGAPTGNAGKSGPPPPPPSPIDSFILPMIIFGLLLAIYLYNKRGQLHYNKEQ